MIEFAEKKKKLTQVQVLAKELAKGPLTGKDIEKLGIMNYKGRICDLRDAIELSIEFANVYKLSTQILVTVPLTKKSRWRGGVSHPGLYKIKKQYRREYKKFLRDFLK